MGGLFSPTHPPACRMILHAGETYATKLSKSGGARRGTWHGGGGALLVRLLRWQFCGGGRWQCRDSRTAAPSSGAAVSSDGERDSCSSLLLYFLFPFFDYVSFSFCSCLCVFFPTPVPLPVSVQSFSLSSPSPSPLSLTDPLPYFQLPHFLSLFFFFRSLSFSFFSFSSLYSLFSLSLCPPLVCAGVGWYL